MTLTEGEAAVRERLRWDFPLLAAHALVITNKRGERQFLSLKPEQVRLWEALREQRDRGEPMRLISLKARQLGISTEVQGIAIQRTTQFSDHHALTLAQEHGTGGELFDIGKRMYDNLPDEADLKPRLVGRSKRRLLEFDNGSWYRADSAKEFESGRGLTLHTLHVSEVAFYPDAQRKLTGLLQAVPHEPGTLVVLESTANGQNYFKELWDAASSGESDYVAFFSPWYEEPAYRRLFANEAERAEFEETVGDGSIGEDEPDLLELGLGLEQLSWRRWMIRNNFAGDLDRFHQEFPTTSDEAFMTSGRHVFDVGSIRRLLTKVRQEQEPVTGSLEVVGSMQQRASRGMILEVPRKVVFRRHAINDDRNPGWRVWEMPWSGLDAYQGLPQSELERLEAEHGRDPGQYIVGVDASGGDEIEGAARPAYHAIEIIDHRTRRQVAEYRSRVDADMLALELYKAALWFNRPWIAIEVTGSWGMPAAKRLNVDFKYPFVYRRLPVAHAKQKSTDLLGWQTTYGTKQLIISEQRELLREETHGIRSRGLAEEYATYVRDDRNRAKPEWGATADRLMAHGIALVVAREKPVRSRQRAGASTTLRGVELTSKSGWFS